MVRINNETQYLAIRDRVEELLPHVEEGSILEDRNLIELELLSNILADYDEDKYPIKKPSLVDVMKLRMAEMNLTQAKLSKLLGVSPSRVSEYMTEKSEPTLKIAREISIKLNISPDVVLGV